HTHDGHAMPNRCDGIEFDAISPDEKGVTYFFKGPYLWKGFHGSAHLSNESFEELDDIHHIGHVDAAFRMHDAENLDDHDHIYFFLLTEDFPGIPDHLDAAVECPKGECAANSVLFFKGHDVHVYDISTKTVKTKTWDHLPVCTSAFRWQEHYYCFHGHNFTRFNPVTGEVNGTYPKDARAYFMSCPGFGEFKFGSNHTTASYCTRNLLNLLYLIAGHGGDYEVPKCSEVKIDAITTDDAGKSYFFAGPMYMRLDTHRDGRHAFKITRMWKELTNGVDAVFSYADKMYMIKDDDVYIYKSGPHYTLIEGYPKTLKEELGIEGHVDAAFVCNNENIVHIVQGKKLLDVDLTATPRAITGEWPLPVSDIDAGLCDAKGVNLFQGSHYYHYESVKTLVASRMAPESHDITAEILGCQD
ncbi:Hemopexin, partial [Nibea albiflora]